MFKDIIISAIWSMIPVVELRGGLPIALELGLNYWLALIICVIGNLIPVPFIIIFIKRIFAWMRKIMPKLNGFITKLEERGAKKSEAVRKYEFWGLFILVAIPLPGTGAWTGALVAALLDMKLKKAFPAIALGVIGAGLIVTAVYFAVKAGLNVGFLNGLIK